MSENRGRRHTLALASLSMFVALPLSACGATDYAEQPADAGQPADARQPARLLAPDDFAAAVAEPDRVTVNVHVPFEGDIAGTDLSIRYDEVRASRGVLPTTDTPLAIYCRSGSMSREAAQVLSDMGYRDVVELDGGMHAWSDDGRRLLRRPVAGSAVGQ
jgi:rhodanese-related sulfurtransferase